MKKALLTAALQAEISLENATNDPRFAPVCTHCGVSRRDSALLRQTIYNRDLEVTIRACARCLGEAGVKEMLEGDTT